MNRYFDKTLSLVKKETCFAGLAEYENTIVSATSKFQAYLDHTTSPLVSVYKKNFMDACAGADCDNAVRGLVDALSDNPGLFTCDILGLLYQGHGNGGYPGWKDEIANAAAYLLTLINSGIMVASAHLVL